MYCIKFNTFHDTVLLCSGVAGPLIAWCSGQICRPIVSGFGKSNRTQSKMNKADDRAGCKTLFLLHSQTYETYNMKFHVNFFYNFRQSAAP